MSHIRRFTLMFLWIKDFFQKSFPESLRLFPCSEFDLPRRSAGGLEDVKQANDIYNQFKKLQMDPWNDVHYVQLQKPDRFKHNWPFLQAEQTWNEKYEI